MGEGGGVNDLDLINLCFFFNGWKQIFLLGRKLYVDTQVVTFDGLFLYVYSKKIKIKRKTHSSKIGQILGLIGKLFICYYYQVERPEFLRMQNAIV